YIPGSFFKKSNIISQWLFGANTPELKAMLRDILQDTDEQFIVWAIDQIVHWDNTEIPQNLIHLHGTADRVLPCRTARPHLKIKNGSHLMTFDKAEEISTLLNSIINESLN